MRGIRMSSIFYDINLAGGYYFRCLTEKKKKFKL